MRAIILAALLIWRGITAAQHERIPMEMDLEDNIIFVTLNINGQDAWFIVDTGAGISIIDRKQAEAFRFRYYPEKGSGKIHSVGGHSEVSLTSHISVSYKEVSLTRTKFYASDIDALNRFLAKRGKEILGIVGADFLQRHQAVIDYGENMIYIRPPGVKAPR